MSLRTLGTTGLLALALAAGPAPAWAGSDDERASKELERARKEVERAREELAKATRELARSVARIQKDNPKAQYFEYITDPKRAMIGIIIDDERPSDTGVPVLAITPGGGAEAAGMRAGDLITGVNGRPLSGGARSPHELLREEMRKVKAGDRIELEYERSGKSRKTTVTTTAPEPDFAFGPLPFMPGFDWDDYKSPSSPIPPVLQPHFRGPAIRGLELAKLDEDLGAYFKTKEGVLVIKAPKDGFLGLKSGDVIQKLDGDAMSEPLTVLDLLRSRDRERAVKLEVLRQGRKVELEGKIPVARSDRHRYEHKIITKEDGEEDAGR